eukprot:863821-Amphidinium_carterae.1
MGIGLRQRQKLLQGLSRRARKAPKKDGDDESPMVLCLGRRVTATWTYTGPTVQTRNITLRIFSECIS